MPPAVKRCRLVLNWALVTKLLSTHFSRQLCYLKQQLDGPTTTLRKWLTVSIISKCNCWHSQWNINVWDSDIFDRILIISFKSSLFRTILGFLKFDLCCFNYCNMCSWYTHILQLVPSIRGTCTCLLVAVRIGHALFLAPDFMRFLHIYCFVRNSQRLILNCTFWGTWLQSISVLKKDSIKSKWTFFNKRYQQDGARKLLRNTRRHSSSICHTLSSY